MTSHIMKDEGRLELKHYKFLWASIIMTNF